MPATTRAAALIDHLSMTTTVGGGPGNRVHHQYHPDKSMGVSSPATTLPMPLSRDDSQGLPIKSIFPATVEQEVVETDGIVSPSPTDAHKLD